LVPDILEGQARAL